MIPFNTAYYNRRFPEIEKINVDVPTLPLDQKETIQRKIKDPSDTQPIDQKQFALMFGDTFIKETKLEGGTPEVNAQYYLKELDRWEKDPSFQELTSDQINSIRKDIHCFLEATRIISSKNTVELKHFIKNELDKSGKVVIPMRVNGKKDIPGHVFSCVFQRNKDGTITYYFLNKGDGAEKHPVLKRSALGKEYLSYRSTSFVLSDPQFFESSGQADQFLNRIIVYSTASPTIRTLSLFKSGYLYDDLTLFADVTLTKKQLQRDNASLFQNDDLGVTPQRSGTCPEQAIRLIIRDSLIRNGADQGLVRRTMFSNKMRGLKNGLHHLSFDDIPSGKTNTWLLKNAAEGLAMQATKMRKEHLITSDKLKETLILVEEVLKKVTEAEEKRVHPIDLANLQDFTVPEVKIQLSADHRERGLKAPDAVIAFASKPHPECALKIDQLVHACLKDPNKILETIQNLDQILREDPIIFESQDLKIAAINAFLLGLPVPKAEGEIYWNRVNSAESDKLIEKLFGLTGMLVESPNSTKRLVRKHVCAITHRLLCNDQKIGKSLQRYGLDPEFKESNKFLFYYPNGEFEALNNELDNYFAKTNKGGFIFSDWRIRDAKDLIKTYLREGTAENKWINTLNLYKECIDSLNIHTKSPVDLYLKILQGNDENPKFKSLFYLNNLVQSARINSSSMQILEVRNENDGSVAFRIEDKTDLEFLPIPKTEDKTLQRAQNLTLFEDKVRENNILKECLASQVLNPGAVESLIRLRNFEKTRIPLLIDWCMQHQELLHLDEVQNFLEAALLKDCVVQQAETLEPKTISQLRTFLDDQMETNKNKTVEFIFWARLSAHVESRLMVLENREVASRIKKIQDKLSACSQNLINVDKNDAYIVALHSLYIYSLFPRMAKHDPEALMQLHSQILLFKLKGAKWEKLPEYRLSKAKWKNKPEWMSRSIDQMTSKSFDLFEKGEQKVVLPSINAYLNLPAETIWKVGYPYTTSASFRIDFHKGIIYKNNHDITSKWPYELDSLFYDSYKLSNNYVFIHCLRHLIHQESPVYKTDNAVEALDGSFRLEKTEQGIGITYEFEINGVKEKFYTDDKYNLRDLGLREYIGKNDVHWVSLNNPDRYLILDADRFEPKGLINRENDDIILERLENESSTGEFAVSLKETPWNMYLSSIASQGGLKVFCKKNENNKWQLSTITIDTLEFQVEEVKGKLRIRSKDFPDYYLSNDQWQGDLLEGAIWLEDAKGTHCKGIIPYNALDPLSWISFVEKLKLDCECGRTTQNLKIPFVYRIDAKKGKLIGESNAAALLQVRLYGQQERYLEAFEVLQNIEFKSWLNSSERWLFENIEDWGEKKIMMNQSPAATALQIHLHLLYLKSSENTIPTHSKIINWFSKDKQLKKLLTRYIQFTGSVEFQRIPEPLRLNPVLVERLVSGDRINTPVVPFGDENTFYHALSRFLTHDYPRLEEVTTKELKQYYSGLSPLMQENEFTTKSFPKFLDRCKNDPFPGPIDWDINILEHQCQIFERQLRLPIKIFLLIWLYRKTKDEELKNHLISYFEHPEKSYSNLIRRCKQLLESLPQPDKTFVKIKQNPLQASVPAQAGEKILLRPQQPLRLSPFKEIVEHYCSKEERLRLPAEPSPLEKINFATTDELSQRFTEELKKAHKNNTNQKFSFYSPKQNIQESSRALENVSKIKSKEFFKEARKLLNEIETLANYPTEEQFAQMSPDMQEEVVNYRLKQQGLQSIKLTFRDPLFQSLLMNSGEATKERNPFLKDKDIHILHTKMLQYLDLMNQKTQADAARPILRNARKKEDTAQFSKAATLLNHDRRYDPHQYPELAVYEYATGFQLRPEQVDLLIRIIKIALSGKDSERLKQLCFEFQAGGGKTKVISAILAARIHAEGKVPIFFSVPHLEDVTQEDLKEALNLVFERKLSRIHYTIKDEISLSEVEAVIATFERALAEKRTLFMTPETWHALNLARTRAIKGRKDGLVKSLDRLFDLMKNKGVALIDEGHLNLEALHETNRASGQPHHIPRSERKLFVTMARLLMQDEQLQRSVKLAQNKQATMLSKHLPDVQKRLSFLLCKEFKRDVAKENRESLREYWLNPDVERPAWMLKLQETSKENLHNALLLKRIDLVRGLLNTVLPFTLNMSNELDYQLPKEAQTEVLIPAKQGFASNSHFQNPDVAALVSCQGTFQNGLNFRQLEKVMEQFVKNYESDLRQGIEDSASLTYFMKIQENCKIEPGARFTLADYKNATKDQKEALLKRCHKQVAHHAGLVEQYLIEEILPKVTIYPSIEQSTATNLAESFDIRIIFSATMGIQEKYLLQDDPEKSHLRDLEFMDQVMTRAALPQNSTMHWKIESTPKSLLNDLSQVEFAEAEGIINVGSFCETASSELWADAFLSIAKEQNLDKKAALFFKVDDKGNRSLCLKVAKEPAEIHMISGSNLAAVFASLGLHNEQVYKIFGPSETTGTDFPISPNARMLLTIGDHVNLSLAIQSIMRMRGFLNDPIDPASSQKISWVGAIDYQEKIHERFIGVNLNPSHFFAYALEKEVENDRAAIKQQAVQEIEAVIIGEVEARRHSGQNIDKHMKAYEKTLGRDPSALYGGASTKVPTKDHLIAHAKAFSAVAGLSFEELPILRQNKIDRIAQRAATLVRMTEQRTGSNLTATMEQHIQVEQKQEQKQEQRAQVAQAENRKTFPEIEHNGSLFSGPISQTFNSHLRLPHALISTIFSEDLFFFENAFSLNPKEKGQPSEIKQVELFLVEEFEGVKRAFVLSGYDADKFINDFNKTQVVSPGKKLGIFTTAGRLVRNGPRDANFTDEEIQSLGKSQWMKNKVCEIGLWNGKIVNKDWMVKKLKSDDTSKIRESCLETWAWVCKKHANPAHLQINTMDELVAETAKKDPVNREGEIRIADIADAADYPELIKLVPAATLVDVPKPGQATSAAPGVPKPGGATTWEKVTSLWARSGWFKAAAILTLGIAWIVAYLYYKRQNTVALPFA